MKNRSACLTLLLIFLSSMIVPVARGEEQQEPTTYVIKQGDTLWGLSQRFLNDPYYWPNLWARNPDVANPHFIYPGQKVRIFPDRIEVEPALEAGGEAARLGEVSIPAMTFTVSGSEGFLVEKKPVPSGYIIATNRDRVIVGAGDKVDTDIGRQQGAKEGDRYSIYKEIKQVAHPVTNIILGYKIDPLGALSLIQVDDRASRAMIDKSYKEAEAGSYLLPYREKRREVAMKSATRDLKGVIVETQTGNEAAGEGDLVYIDLGKKDGIEEGNLLYVVRDVKPEKLYGDRPVETLPVEVFGAVVVTEAFDTTSTVLIIKSVETIYRGDRVEVKAVK